MSDTWVLGGKGSMEGDSSNGGGYVNGSDSNYENFQTSNGEPVSDSGTWNGSQTACTVGGFGNYVEIVRAGAFSNCVRGTYAYVEFNGANPADDYYEITEVDDGEDGEGGNGDYIGIVCTYSADSTHCDVHVGGAFGPTGTGFAQGLSLFEAASGDELQVATDIISSKVYLVAAEINVPSIHGAAAAPFRIYGVNHLNGNELVEGNKRPIMQATATITSMLNWTETPSYFNIENIDWDGNNKATYCWRWDDDTGSNYHTIKNSRFYNAISIGIYMAYGGDWCQFFGNEFDNNGGAGVWYGGKYLIVEGNKFHHNGSDGVRLPSLQAISFCFNKIYSNGGKGLYTNLYNKASLIENNTIYNNVGDGIDHSQYNADQGYSVAIINNTIFGNGGYAINNSNIGSFNWPKKLMQLSNNHSWDNTLGHCREMTDPTSDSEWETFMDGNYGDNFYNITGDPKVISTTDGSEDFDLLFDSPLQRNGINNTTIGAGSRKEISEGAKDVAFNAIYIQPEEDIS